MQLKYVATGLVVVFALAGCQRTNYDYNSGGNMGGAYNPPPLQAQPVPSVQAGNLPPPGAADPNQFPTAPVNTGNTQVASLDPSNALDVTKESMVGNWRVSNGGASCGMFLTLTNLGRGSRGGPRGCVGDLTSMGSWEVAGKAVVFKNRNGDEIGRVHKNGATSYSGTTSSGQPLSLSR